VNFENKVQVNHYDGEGLRHEMEENGKLVKFLYADREAVAEEKEDGNVIRFIRGYDLIASDSENARTYYHYASDEQGSVTHVLGEDENGEYKLKNYYEYGAFGDFREQYEEEENRFGYNGEIFDPVGGQYYLRARYYNPVIGRFTQEDTYYGAGLNLYAYCRNLPVGYIDPSGHQPCDRKQDLYKEYREKGYKAEDANIMANYELIREKQGVKVAEKYLQEQKIKQLEKKGYKQDKDGRWHKNGKYVSNAELGIVSINGANSTGASSQILRRNLEEQYRKAGKKLPEYPNAAHHIVAGNDSRALVSREILAQFGIDINDANNGVFLPTVDGVSNATNHRIIHTDAYHQEVFRQLSYATTKQEAINILNRISRQIQNNTFTY